MLCQHLLYSDYDYTLITGEEIIVLRTNIIWKYIFHYKHVPLFAYLNDNLFLSSTQFKQTSN